MEFAAVVAFEAAVLFSLFGATAEAFSFTGALRDKRPRVVFDTAARIMTKSLVIVIYYNIHY